MRPRTLPCQWHSLALALGCMGGIHAAPPTFVLYAHKLKESITAPPGWTNGARALPDHGIELRIALLQERFAELERHLLETSDPSHSRYGQHLSKEEVEALVAPPAESVAMVDKWLEGHGIPEAAQDRVTVVVSVQLAEEMLATVRGRMRGLLSLFRDCQQLYDAVLPYLEYLEMSGMYTGLYDVSGRTQQQSVNFLNYVAGEIVSAAGTSCSSPAFAAVIALLNDARLAKGKSTVGFLNPWLYSSGWMALNDITEGHAPGCGTQGFYAKKGWDSVTGLGTSYFYKLKELVLNN